MGSWQIVDDAAPWLQKVAKKMKIGYDHLENNFKFGDKKILQSNNPINSAYKFVTKGERALVNNLADGKGLKESLKAAYKPDGNWDVGAIAGTYVGAAVAGRVLTGGGLYRDNTGNVNLPGVPFL